MSPNRSFWVDDAGPQAPSPPLAQDLRVDVAVIGGGFTGLSTAWHLRRLDPAVRVALLESEEVGYGASGRNSGWVMPHLGIGGDLMRQLFGSRRSSVAHEYAIEAVDYVEQLVHEHGIDSDFRRNGSIRVALGDRWVPALEKEMAAYEKAGLGDRYEWLDRSSIQQEVASPYFAAGIAERTTAFLQPVKHVRELKRLAVSEGVQVYERTPVVEARLRSGLVKLATPSGTVTADKVVLATNAYTHLLRGLPEAKLKRRQFPVFVYGSMTEPLTKEQWDELGWHRRGGIQTTINGFQTVHPTPDGRLLLAHDGYAGTRPGDAMDGDYDMRALRTITDQYPILFPTLRGVRITHFWGGPVSFAPELVPHLGPMGDERILGFYGDVGHGVSITHLNGLILAEIALGRPSAYSDLWFVGRRTRRWPSLAAGRIGINAALRAFRAVDRRQTKAAGIALPYY